LNTNVLLELKNEFNPVLLDCEEFVAWPKEKTVC